MFRLKGDKPRKMHKSHLSKSIYITILPNSRRGPDQRSDWQGAAIDMCYVEQRSFAFSMSADMMRAIHKSQL